MSAPKLMHGNRDLIEQLEEALAEAKEGKLVGVVICGITGEGCGWTGAYNEGIQYPWPRLLAALETARHELSTEGVEHWS